MEEFLQYVKRWVSDASDASRAEELDRVFRQDFHEFAHGFDPETAGEVLQSAREAADNELVTCGDCASTVRLRNLDSHFEWHRGQ